MSDSLLTYLTCSPVAFIFHVASLTHQSEMQTGVCHLCCIIEFGVEEMRTKEGLRPHLIPTAMSTLCHVPITVVTLHFLLSDLRCHPGWTGNRCHVKEKVWPSTAAPEPEDLYLGRKPAQLPFSSRLWFHSRSTADVATLSPDAVYAGIAIGLLLLVAGVSVCILACCKKRCFPS